MDQRTLVSLISFCLLFCVASLPAQRPDDERGPARKQERVRTERADGKARPVEEREARWRQMLQSASPEERERLRKNRQKWEQLSDEERAEIRQRGRLLHEEMRSQVEETMERVGLKLDGEQRRRFVEAYLSGRRQIEIELREEMQALRATRLRELENRLKAEFSGGEP